MSRELKLILAYLRPYKWRYAIGGVFLTCSDIGQLLVPFMIGKVIDGLAARQFTQADLTWYAWAIVGCALFTAFSRYFWRIYVFGTAREVERQVRQKLYDHLQSLSMSFHLKSKVGDLMAHATNDVQAMRGVAGEGFMAGWDAIAMATGACLMMFGTVHWKLALVALMPLLLLPVASYLIGKRLHVWYGTVQSAFSVLSDRAQENIAGIRVVKGFSREAQQEARFAEANDAYRHAFARMARFDRGFDPTINLLSGLSFALGLGYGGTLVVSQEITLGQYVAFNTFLAHLIWPMLALGWVMNIIQRATASMKRLQAIFDLVPEVADAPDAKPLPAPEGRVSVLRLTFRYAPELPPALEDVSFELAPGRTVGILGGTGAGKTTLANLLVRLFNPPEGRVLLDGTDVNGLKLEDLRRAIAYVPQDSFLFSRTIADNIAFEPAPHEEPEVREASRLAQLDGDVQGFSAGYTTMLGERGITLSGGQRQRVSIARALLKDARVLVLDDCLSAVDTLTETKILAELRPFMASRAALVISHRVSALQHADEILVLQRGRVVERGTHSELVAAGGEYARLYKKQQLEAAIERM